MKKYVPTRFPVRIDRGWGYINSSGKVVLPYWEGYFGDDFSEGLCVFRDPNPRPIQWSSRSRIKNPPKKFFYGYVDQEGRIAIEARFRGATEFRCGVAAVEVSRRDVIGFINRNGELISESRFAYENIGNFSEGMVYLKHGDAYGYLNTRMEWAIPPQFSGAYPFSEGLAAVNVGGQIVDDGERGTIWMTRGGLWGFVDMTGAMVIEPRFDGATEFSEGLCFVQQGKKWGYIDPRGKFVLEPEYDYTHFGGFSEGISIHQIASGLRAIDQKGDTVFEVPYRHPRPFSEGRAAVEVDGRIGFIDRKGNLAIPPKFQLADPFTGGLSRVFEVGESNCRYIDLDGTFVW